MNTYIAFLRGINLGKRTVKMGDLKSVLEKNGFANVRTILASGNVVFDIDAIPLKNDIEKILEEEFGFKIEVILRTKSQIEALVRLDPFKTVQITKNTRLYVTFLSLKPPPEQMNTYLSPDGDFQIIDVSGTEVCSVLTLAENKKTPDLMGLLEKKYGKNVTTRNWNTVLRIAKVI